MARRDLLTDTERRALFGVPTAREDLARHYMLSARDLALVAARRGDTNRIGFAVQLAVLRHPGFGFTLEEGVPAYLVAFMGEQIGVADSAFGAMPPRPRPRRVTHARRRPLTVCGRPPTPPPRRCLPPEGP